MRNNLLLIIIALVLAFLVGRFTAHIPGEHVAPREDPPGAVEAAQKLLDQGAADGTWSATEDAAFLEAVSKLGQESELRQLRALAQRVNGGKLKLEPVNAPQVPPPCMHVCPPANSNANRPAEGR